MNYKNNNKTTYGLALIITAVLIFLSAFNLLPPKIFTQIITYTLIIYGLYSLIKLDFYKGLFSIGISLKLYPQLLQPYLDFNDLGWFVMFLIIILLATGLETLFGKKFTWKKTYKNNKFSGAEFTSKDQFGTFEEDLFGEFVSASVTMSESTRNINTKYLKEAILNCQLGALNVYFSDEVIINDINIVLNCTMGNINLYLPKNWSVVNNVKTNIANVKMNSNNPNSQFKVYLLGDVNLGNINVYFG